MKTRFLVKYSVLQWISLNVQIFVIAMLMVFLGQSPAFAQPEQSDHESHHPAAAPTTPIGTGPASDLPTSSMPSTNPIINPPPNSNTSNGAASNAAISSNTTSRNSTKPEQNPPSSFSSMPTSPTNGPGMMEGMQKMMKDMMAPKKQSEDEGCCGGVGTARRELYPFLMSLPAWTHEIRLAVERLSQERIHKGTNNFQISHNNLSKALQTSDIKATEQALQQSRDSLGLIASGVAAHRLLIEGSSPQNAASLWFKREMNLTTEVMESDSILPHGVTPLHVYIMGLLIALALAMVVMYFFKMRRAANLFGRIDADSGSPPPGAAPALAGKPPPSTPADKPAADEKEISL